jgi:hypothetical protein
MHMQQKHAAWTCSVGMQNGHKAQKFRTGMQHEQAAWKSSRMQQGHAYTSLKTLAFSLSSGFGLWNRFPLSSGFGLWNWFPVWFGKGRKKRKFVLLSVALCAFVFFMLFFLCSCMIFFCMELASTKAQKKHDA